MSKAIDLENGLPAIKTWVEGKFVEKENGKGLSTNDYTTDEKTKLAGIEAGAEVNVQADWNVTSTTSDAYIKNKPSIPAASSTAPKMDGTAAVGTGTTWARADHVHPTDTSRAPLASPALTGTPTAPTAAAGTNTTQIATTAFVKTAVDNVTVADFTGATSSAAGTHGLVPAPAADSGLPDVGKYLRSDGSWDLIRAKEVFAEYGSETPDVNSWLESLEDGKVEKVAGKGLSTNDYTTAEKNKLAGIAAGAEANVQSDWNVTDSASDAFIKNKPTIDDALSSTSTNAVQNAVINTALGTKVDKVSGKGLSTNDYTTTEKNKLANIAAGAQVNVIESVKVNGTALSITSKAVDVPKATNSVYGATILSDATDGTAAAASGGTAATPKAVADALAAAKSYADSAISSDKSTWYGTSSTASGTATKVVTTTSGDFSLEVGNRIYVLFSNSEGNTSDGKLQVDSTDAKSYLIAKSGTTLVGSSGKAWGMGELVEFIYVGTYFVMVDGMFATTANYGSTILSDSTSSSESGVAATSKAVKAAYDLANGKAPTSHASTATTYGVGNASNYGHLKLSDSTSSTSAASNGTAATPKAVADALTAAKSYADGKVAGLYTYKGSVATYADLPASPATGDVYNVEAAYGDYPAGTNWAWTGTVWDSLGGSFTITYATAAEVTAVLNA